jgi:N-acetylglucosamine transport system permease protein
MQRFEKWSFISVFLAPAMLLYSIFVVYPSLQGIQISLYKWSGLSQRKTYVGLANFQRLFKELTDPADYYNIRTYLGHNAFLFIFGLITIALGLAAAALINNRPRGAKWLRIAYFFPNVLALPAIAVLWSMVLNPEYGLINNALRAVGLESLALPWMSLQYDMPLERLGMYSVGMIGLWAGLGWNMILFLAAIQNVPTDYIEAALIDGASKLQSFIRITLPLIWETTRTLLLFAVIGALNTFGLTFVLFENQANKNSDVIMNYYYWQAFGNNNWGYASAIVVAIFAITLVASVFAYRTSEREAIQF